jgi:uncharacterized membrane protein HdeD (DUF308 family)
MTDVDLTDPPVTGKWWWVLLVTGILWILIGLYVLQAHVDSAVLVGWLVGFWLIFAGIAEFAEAALAVRWTWLHIAMGILFVIGGFLALLAPFQTFMVLAALLGIFLIIKGTFDFVIAISFRHEVELWWFTLIAGIIEIGLGVWAMGYQGRSAALLLLWVGIGAIIRGVVQIVTSVHIHAASEMAVAA